ncbi:MULTISPECIES: CaiB/BaiF CoA transferase family protein [unclassified Rhodococcus (in: high G+C Gram-positive bacteria)]|uniref:CaiB/BaiF CoA transferase family protein n=1 Tax=unclassified Rhodococcus (in: high G+C Gram-positive bacteria) TaxID=192944 RepID=UPI0006F38ABD|nr:MULTISPECIES: CoA transferase [unclassified Rhodococcus (in: high G+C Gram-positive bacteria)]KQU28493.1 CoA-transferase [Rhodococcus sp. Leaf225]KQU47626.1 CoA-transferase [Rhodococcus sp. Leaf258]
MDPTSGPLAGVRVVDISSSYAAPTTSMYLADMGADVIKIEPTRGDDARGWGPPFLNGEAAWFLSVNRNKRSMCLDIRGQAGRQVLFSLLETADVFIENINPVKLAKHGLDPDTLRSRFPQLIVCAFSGFGLTGPDSALPGYDLIAQARSGIMSVTGADGVPQRVSTALSDVAAGTVAAFAISSALVKQQRTGEGEVVDIALLEADLAFMSPRIASYLAGDPEPSPCSGRDSVVAIYQSMVTADRPIVVAIGNDRHWVRACDALGLHELGQREDLRTNADRRAKREEVVGLFQARLLTMSSETALKTLQSVGVPCSQINSLSEVVSDPQVEARKAIVPYEHPVAGTFRGVGTPWRLASDPEDRQARLPAPLRGEHGREVLAEIGLDDAEIAALTNAEVVWVP